VRNDGRRAEWLRDRPPRKLTQEQIEFFRSDVWFELRRLVLERAKGRCEGERCFKLIAHESKLDIHHVTCVRFGGRERLDALVALCGDCHLEVTIDSEIGKAGTA